MSEEKLSSPPPSLPIPRTVISSGRPSAPRGAPWRAVRRGIGASTRADAMHRPASKVPQAPWWCRRTRRCRASNPRQGAGAGSVATHPSKPRRRRPPRSRQRRPEPVARRVVERSTFAGQPRQHRRFPARTRRRRSRCRPRPGRATLQCAPRAAPKASPPRPAAPADAAPGPATDRAGPDASIHRAPFDSSRHRSSAAALGRAAGVQRQVIPVSAVGDRPSDDDARRRRKTGTKPEVDQHGDSGHTSPPAPTAPPTRAACRRWPARRRPAAGGRCPAASPARPTRIRSSYSMSTTGGGSFAFLRIGTKPLAAAFGEARPP